MTDLQETIRHKGNTFAQVAEEKMNQWRGELTRLEREINELDDPLQANYFRRLAALKLNWQQVEAKFSTMTRADEAAWEQARQDWQETAVAYQTAFHKTADEIRQLVPLGWLQGYTNLRTMDSEGWAQGVGPSPCWLRRLGRRHGPQRKTSFSRLGRRV
ncbi:MAG: hypothetical protein IPJ90_15765 [Anaerolineaceae bacterium]|nr:hypothetical protein [Anaerolineaceae bacterium]